MTAPNSVCQPGGSCEEAFLYLSLGQVEPWCCRAAILDLVCFLERCIFLFFFLFSFRILELPIMPFSPTLSLQFHLVSLQSSILCRLFQLLPSGQQVSQKSELGLHKHCWILDHRQLNHWEEGYRDNRLFWKTIGILL